MNILTKEMRRSLKELDLGLKGELTITNDMEDLGNSLFFDQVLEGNFAWLKLCFISLLTSTLKNIYEKTCFRRQNYSE